MKKGLFLGLALVCLILFTSMVSISVQKITTGEIIKEDGESRCNNFNGREFLLTGGTGIPETAQGRNIEIGRLNWLCNGGIR